MRLIVLIFFLSIITIVNGQSNDKQKIDNYIAHVQLDSARNFIQDRLELTTVKEEIKVLNYELVKVLFIQSEYNAALKQAFQSLDSIDKESDRVNFNFMIGCIYSAITDYQKSIEYFDLVVTHSEDASLLVQTHLLLSQLHTELGDTASASKSINNAYEITKKASIDPKVKNHVAMQYNFFNKNYELCKQQNLEIINDTTSFLNAKSYAYSMIGDCLMEQDSLQTSTTYYDEFLKLTVETKDPEQIKVAANKLITVYEKLGNQEKANAYHKIYNEAVSDSLSFSVEKYRELYNVEKDRELSKAHDKNYRTYIIIGIILLIIIAMVWFTLSRKRDKTNSQLLNEPDSTPGKKFVVSDVEIEKIETAISLLKSDQLFLKPNITRKSFCAAHDIKSERYLSHYINEKYDKSFSLFINDLRIEYAYNRIQSDSQFRNYRIEEIAKASGFGSKKSFERAFQAKYNETPYKLISRLIN
ncbi:MAG: helix-turn-helix domain-containing protein [Nonlabens sp.]|uniref:helix-turn-helix domain-containing protein n=1 Tax=Nonlabens sp. TaxID=1888209 RepID=UPI003EF98E46